jgi:hypothetical protein
LKQRTEGSSDTAKDPHEKSGQKSEKEDPKTKIGNNDGFNISVRKFEQHSQMQKLIPSFKTK